mmetsp:Transcript_34618/g.82026  ORF Transcript_34618/g.82026 Transcript_34618/m.82026 type:complete len:345 (-) Transcript_34618:44-1078(-)
MHKTWGAPLLSGASRVGGPLEARERVEARFQEPLVHRASQGELLLQHLFDSRKVREVPIHLTVVKKLLDFPDDLPRLRPRLLEQPLAVDERGTPRAERRQFPHGFLHLPHLFQADIAMPRPSRPPVLVALPSACPLRIDLLKRSGPRSLHRKLQLHHLIPQNSAVPPELSRTVRVRDASEEPHVMQHPPHLIAGELHVPEIGLELLLVRLSRPEQRDSRTHRLLPLLLERRLPGIRAEHPPDGIHLLRALLGHLEPLDLGSREEERGVLLDEHQRYSRDVARICDARVRLSNEADPKRLTHLEQPRILPRPHALLKHLPYVDPAMQHLRHLHLREDALLRHHRP